MLLIKLDRIFFSIYHHHLLDPDCKIQITAKKNFSLTYFKQNCFNSWQCFKYRLPRIVVIWAKLLGKPPTGHPLYNVLYLNKRLFHFGITSQSKCSFCKLYDETSHHIFYECVYAQNLWNQLRLYISEKVTLLILNPQSAIFVFTDVLDHNCLYLHLLIYLHLIICF